MKKRRNALVSLLLGAAIISTVFAMAGCSSGSAVDSTSSGEKAVQTEGEKKKLVVWSRGTADSMEGRCFLSDIEAFKEKYPDVEVEYLILSTEDQVAKWNTAFASGTDPDVMDIGIAHIVGRVDLGQLRPLDDFVANWDQKDNLMSAMVDYGEYDGHTYCLAYNASPSVMAWRKDYFKAAGLDPDRAPASWEEFLEYCEKLTIYNGSEMVQGGVALPSTYNANILWQFLIQNEAEESTFNSGSPDFAGEGVVEAFKFLQDIAPYAVLGEKDNTYSAFVNGQAAMSLMISPATLISMMEEDASLKDNIGYAASLVGKRGGIHCGAWTYAITERCKDSELAWQWIDFVFSEERCRARMEEEGMVPPLQSLQEEYRAFGGEYGDLYVTQLTNLKQSQAYPKISWSNPYEETLRTTYDWLVYGEKTPEQAGIDATQTCLGLMNK